jgi:hypothetical protein
MRLLDATSIVCAIGGGVLIATIVLVRPGCESTCSRSWARSFWLLWAGALPLGAYDLMSDVAHAPGLPAALVTLKDLLTIGQFVCACGLWRALHDRQRPRCRRRLSMARARLS